MTCPMCQATEFKRRRHQTTASWILIVAAILFSWTCAGLLLLIPAMFMTESRYTCKGCGFLAGKGA